MKFRYKVTICMISLIALIFGIGGTVLLYMSFNNSLEREKVSATKSFNMLINTFSFVNQASRWTTTDEISEDFDKIVNQNDFFDTARLCKDKDVIYKKNNKVQIMDDLSELVGSDKAAYKIICRDTNYYIQLCSEVKVEGADIYVDVLYDISQIYEQRGEQQKLYGIIFLIMVACSAVFSYVLAYILTKPISRLKRTASSISQGQYELRSDVCTNDEIGELAAEFNHMTDALVDKMEELNAAMERQSQFIGNFTHELKTPMTSIIGYADLLRRQTLSDEDKMEATNYLFSESKRLERLSIKMLELIVAEGEDHEFGLHNPSYLIEEIVKHYAAPFEKQGIRIETSCQAGTCRIEADFFTSMVINLLENARRSMENGGTIKINLLMTEYGCELWIIDSGCGIPAEKLTHITEAFYRVDKARSRSFGGAGLGLSLCERIAKLHNGSLEIKSTVGVGTRVCVQLKGGRE